MKTGPAWMAAALSSALSISSAYAQEIALNYESALKNYRPYSDEKLKPWREVNDKLRTIGGWRSYAKEAAILSAEPSSAVPEPATPAPKAPASAPAAPVANPHASHGVKS